MSRWTIGIAVFLVFAGVYLFLSQNVNRYTMVPFNPPKELTFSSHEGWQDYNGHTGFTAKFPFVPQRARDTIKDKKTESIRHYDMYASETPSGGMFVVSVISFSDEAHKIDSEELMRKIVMEMVDRKEGNTIVKLDKSRLGNSDAMDFAITGQNHYMEGTVVMHGEKIYLLTEVVPGGTEPKDFTYFRNSFHLEP